IKIEALVSGTYVLLASIDSTFTLSRNILARQIFYVSNISYISGNKEDLFVLNRDNGLPLAKAEVQIWQQTYNYTSSKYEDIKKEKYITGENGYAKLNRSKEVNNNKIQVK